MGHIVLQGDEHDGGERHHPQQGVAELGAGGEVAGPVARVDEADGDEQARTDILEDVEGAQHVRVVLALQFLDDIFHTRWFFDCKGTTSCRKTPRRGPFTARRAAIIPTLGYGTTRGKPSGTVGTSHMKDEKARGDKQI